MSAVHARYKIMSNMSRGVCNSRELTRRPTARPSDPLVAWRIMAVSCQHRVHAKIEHMRTRLPLDHPKTGNLEVLSCVLPFKLKSFPRKIK